MDIFLGGNFYLISDKEEEGNIFFFFLLLVARACISYILINGIYTKCFINNLHYVYGSPYIFNYILAFPLVFVYFFFN